MLQATLMMMSGPVRLLIDDTSTVRQIFIQTTDMKVMFATFPAVVMLDGTYSINNSGMPLYAFFGAGWACGHGQLVGLSVSRGRRGWCSRLRCA